MKPKKVDSKKSLIDVAARAAKKAGAFLKNNVGKINEIKEKFGQDKNLVTEIDRASEDLIISYIRKQFPRSRFLAEESGETNPSECESSPLWIIDPLDGTTNYTHGFPVFCVSIGVMVKNHIVAGAIYDPNFDELFTAQKGRGAFLNGRRLKVSTIASVRKSLLVTGFPYNIVEDPHHAVEHFVDFLMKAQAVRRMGSAAIDMAYVAAGRYEGFWEVNLHPWDVAAGGILVSEAGGRLSNFDGGEYDLFNREIVASNSLVHDEMISILSHPTPIRRA
jgi:myo-inositol-1(or 4)-monophosphatase